MFGSLLKHAQKVVNNQVGNNYREIYLKRYPQDTHVCTGCRKEVPTSQMQVDHIIPKKHGGSNAITNLQAMCAPCNNEKKAKINELSMKYSGAALIREIKRLFS